MNSVFSEQILADKLSKLNSTQQCIETLSHWCIFHRSKAELVAVTWDKQFHSSQMVQKVPLLYLANDILQNSKRKGNEFVSEFWKVLPSALKDVLENGDDHGKNVVSRLVNIWEERRVFGSRTRSLKEVMLGEQAPPPLQFSSKKRSRSVKIVKRDSRSIRTKLTIGGVAEKIVSAFHLVLSEHSSEDAEMSKCKSAVHRIRKLERDFDVACSSAKDPKRKTLSKELEEEENSLKQCIEKLKSVEARRLALVSQLKEALHEQESELENVRTQMQVAQGQAEEASYMRKRLDDEDYVLKLSTSTIATVDANSNAEQNKKSAAAIAAEVADKLTASSSSQFIMASVLHTFAAEESKNAGLTNARTPSNTFTSLTTTSGNSVSKPSSVQPPIAATNHLYQSVLVPQPALQNQASTSQAQYHVISNPTSHQFLHPPAGVMNPYGYSNVPPLPPVGPSPPPPYMVSPMVPLSQQPLQLSQQQPMSLSQQPVTIAPQRPVPLTQQVSTAPNFRPLQPPGMVYYGHPHYSQ